MCAYIYRIHSHTWITLGASGGMRPYVAREEVTPRLVGISCCSTGQPVYSMEGMYGYVQSMFCGSDRYMSYILYRILRIGHLCLYMVFDDRCILAPMRRFDC